MYNESICIVESQLSNEKIFEVGKLQGGGIALGLGIVAGIGSIVRGLFIYFIKYEAPKERPINSLMLHDQVRSNCPFYLNFVIIQPCDSRSPNW